MAAVMLQAIPSFFAECSENVNLVFQTRTENMFYTTASV